MKVDLPVGAVLRRTRTDHLIPNDPPSTLEIARGERALGYIEAPLVYDADGVSVQSNMRIEGADHIVISVKHQQRDLSYPLYADPEVTVVASKTAGWSGWRNAQYPSPASQSVNYYGWALNDPAYNASGVYMSMPSNTWFSPSGTAASWTYQAPANTYIYRAIFGGMDHTPLRDGYAFSLWYQGLANSPYTWEPNVSYANQSGGFGGNPFGPAAHAAQGQTHDFCFNTRCDRGQGSEQNIAHLGLAASNPYTGQAFYTYGYRAKLTMNWANILLGDRLAPTFRNSAPPSSGWENDNAGEHDPGLIAVSDQGLGLTGVTLSGAASGNGTIRERACTGDPQRDPCPKTLDTAGFRYRLNEGQTTLTLTAKDIVDNIVSQTWTKKIDRSKPQLEVNGWLPNTDGLIFTGIDYDLSIAASDRVSGVKSIEVLVDGQRLPENGFKQQDCGADGCDLILNTTLIAGSYDPGPHSVRIVAKDFADNEERVELAVDISDVAAAPPRERDPISDELGEDAPEPPAEPGIDTTCDPAATDGSDTDCARDDLADPIEQAVASEPGLIENLATPLLNTLEELLSGPQARAAGSLAKNGSGWGLSDQKAQTFVPDDPATPEREGYLDLFTPLDVTRLRLVVPWDLVPRAKGTFNGDPYPKSFEHRDPNEPRPVVGLGGRLGRLKATDEWIARALPCDPDKRLGEVMISFEKSESLSDDPDDVRHENLLPSTNEYVYAVGEFRKRYLGRCQADKDKDETSKITVFTAWNEPNFGKQPTRGNRLDRAGAYWSQLNRICKTTPITAYRCTVAAGDFIDARYSSDPNFGLNGDVRRYARGMNRPASTWALHAYGTSHAPFAEAETRIKRFLKLTTSQSGHEPRLWLTEQGGRFNVPDTEPAPTPAADFCNLMQFRNISNRITRFYYYPLVGPPPDADGVRRNDSALIALNADNSITPRDPQYETYKFYASKMGGSQRC